VFDQIFHRGINIIRGDNSVGKSTVMDLIFFSLGGDLRSERWTKEAASCEWVIAEVDLNGEVFTLSRPIDVAGRPPMYIFEGDYASAADSSKPWSQYGIMRTENKYSFSQQLFELLGWPQHKNDDSSNLTMHQILRMIYVDQDTPVNKILKSEVGLDKPNMRQAIGDFLLGVDDLDTYSLKQRLAKAEAGFAKIQGQLEAVYRFISPTEGVLRIEHLESEISQTTLLMQRVEEERGELLLKSDPEATDTIRAEVDRLAGEISQLSKSVEVRLSRKAELESEIIESELFLDSLDYRLKSLQESKSSFDFFGEIKFKYCPSCLTLVESSATTKQCHLCKTSMDSNARETAYLSALNELNFQKKESLKVLTEMRLNLSEASAQVQSEQGQLIRLKGQHRLLLVVGSDRLMRLNELSMTIGSIQEKIINLNSKIRLVSSVEGLVKEKEKLNVEIDRLREQIKQLKYSSEGRKASVETNLSQRTVNLITQDGGFESAFVSPEVFQFDFQKDLMLLDGRSKFSASSETILKNSFHLAVLLESIFDESMRYPRLLLLDNIEDKGMTPARSQNFQRVVVASLDSVTQDYQVIMTTTMIAPELEGSKFCVGSYYKKGDHTLVFSSGQA